MLRFLAAALLGAGSLALSSPPAADPPPLQVTYVANEGFLISAGGSTVAVDALFHGASIDWCQVPTEATAERMASARPPFDAIDLVLVTHWHSDHFTPRLVLDHLRANTKAHLAASPQAVAMLRGLPGFDEGVEARIHEIDLPLFGMKALELGGIRVEAWRIRHGAYMLTDETTGVSRNKHEDVENLAFVVEMGGRSFVHFGDALLKEDLDLFDGKRFPPRRVDLALLEGWSDATLATLEVSFEPASVVIMHMPPDPARVEAIASHVSAKLPGAVIFRKMMETRQLP